MPTWRESNYDPSDEAGDPISALFAYLVLAPLLWIVLPLCPVIAELPIALIRPLFSSTRWLEAECRWPSEIKIIWRTSCDRAEEAAAHVTSHLARGYENLTPPGAERVFMTRPPGADDHSS